MDSGVAGTLGVKHISGDGDITNKVNEWLDRNGDLEVIDIKFATQRQGAWAVTTADVLIIFRRD